MRDAFGIVLGWLERWRAKCGLEAGRESCKRFWREPVMVKDRESWQLEQWSGAIQWYLRWFKYRQGSSGEVTSLEERVRDAVENTGARGGLARRSRETCRRWAGDGRACHRRTDLKCPQHPGYMKLNHRRWWFSSPNPNPMPRNLYSPRLSDDVARALYREGQRRRHPSPCLLPCEPRAWKI
jgi:hypothetical protein